MSTDTRSFAERMLNTYSEKPKTKIDELRALDKKATNARKEILNHVVVSHRDLDLPNVLWDINDTPTIIDWESSGVVNPCEELLETAWDWSGGQEYFDEEKFKCFIHTYKNNGGDLKDLDKAIYSNFKNKSLRPIAFNA